MRFILGLSLLSAFLGSGLVQGEEFPSADFYCERISYINEIPFKQGLPVHDEVYAGFLRQGSAALPCLAAAVMDTALMHDPRGVPGPPSYVSIGDVAFFVWLDITGASMTEVLPEDVAEEFSTKGMDAYWEFIGLPWSRRALKQRLQEWVPQKAQSQPPRGAEGV